MRTLVCFLIVGVLSGCATTTPNPWKDLTMDTSPAVGPIDCPRFPLPSSFTADTIVYDEDGANAMEAYRACAEDNRDLVTEHAAQIGQLKIARKGLTEAGIAQRNISDMRQEILEQERRHWLFERIGYVILTIGAIAL